MKKHRNSQKRIYLPDTSYFVTSKTFNNFPYFKEPVFCNLFMENLRLCKRLKRFLLFGWVLIYDHFHLLVQPNDDFDISDVMQFLKRHVSRDINWIMSYNKYDQVTEGGIRESRLCGGKYENYKSIILEHGQKLQKLKSKFQQKYSNGHFFPKFRWQKSFHDHTIRNQNDFDKHMQYIANNPFKHHMPDGRSYIFTNPEYEDLADECI